VIFQKRFYKKDLHTLRQVKGKVVLQISEAYYLKNPGWLHNISHFMKRADAIVAGSPPIHHWFHKKKKRVVMIPTGLDFAALPKGHKHPPIKVCWIGNAGNEKYLLHVLNPINALWGKINFELRIIGAKMPTLPKDLHWNHRPNFIKWQLDKAERQVSECHIGIAPLDCAGYEFAKPPSKPVLYMAQGLAVAATDTPSYRALIRNGVNGYLIGGNNPHRWQRALGTLIGNIKQRNSIISHATKDCKRFDAPNIAKQWDAFLKGL